MEPRAMTAAIRWLGHAGFLLKDKRVVYIDPYKLASTEVGDLILITHDHYDHCSPDDVARLQQGATVIACPPGCAQQLKGDIRVVKPGDTLEVEGVGVEAVPAYNPSKRFHAKEAGGVGYIVTMPGGMRVYHAGDTDLILEMEHIQADVALLPVGGTYTMDAAEAAQAANLIKPKLAIPMHWGSIVGSRHDAEKFKSLCQVEVRILKAEP